MVNFEERIVAKEWISGLFGAKNNPTYVRCIGPLIFGLKSGLGSTGELHPHTKKAAPKPERPFNS
jgi:hypothetical protein